MARRCLVAIGAVVGLLAGLFLSQCFAPNYADCAFRCGSVDPVCPDEYQCQPDGFCHLPNSAAICVPVPDLGGDFGGIDAAFGDLAGRG